MHCWGPINSCSSCCPLSVVGSKARYKMLDSGIIQLANLPIFNVPSQSLHESVLQIFYVFMGIYGWSQWNLNTGKDKALKVSTWSLRRHVIVIFSILGFSFLAGNLLGAYTNAALPFFDSLTTFGALVATYMVAKKKLENWIYWFVIDSISVSLFFERELYLTALLFCLYLIIIIFGFRSWFAEYRLQ